MEICIHGWVESVSSGLIIVGAFVGGLGASSTVRRALVEVRGRVGAWFRAVWRALLVWLKRLVQRIRHLYRKGKNLLLLWIERIQIRLGRKTGQTIRGMAASRIGVSSFAKGTITQGPPSMAHRVQVLEDWKENQTEDYKIQTKWLAVGFGLIVVGESIRLVC